LKTTIALAAAAALCAPGVASAQYRQEPANPGYRPGQPAVNAAPVRRVPNARVDGIANDFRRWYGQAQRPSLLIFWNRELSDEATTEYAEVKTDKSDVRSKRTTVGADDSPVQADDQQESRVATSETSRRRLTGGTYAPLDRMLSSQLESAYQGMWLKAGVEVVDRTALIRKMSAVAGKDDRADTQFMESLALEQGVDYLVEVLPNASASSPTGLVFTVRVKHLPSSTVVAQFNTTAQPTQGQAQWVATNGGFERRAEDRTNPENIGATLAAETMRTFIR
jgi:hypothetical protein